MTTFLDDFNSALEKAYYAAAHLRNETDWNGPQATALSIVFDLIDKTKRAMAYVPDIEALNRRATSNTVEAQMESAEAAAD